MQSFRLFFGIFIGFCLVQSLVGSAQASEYSKGPIESSQRRMLFAVEGFSPVPLDEEKSCCDLCFEAAVAQGERPGGRVCCCEDDAGDVVPEACSFADKYPNEWPPGPGQDILNECIQEHEEGHVAEGEGVCTNIDDGNPSVWGRGQNHETCEPNQYENEIDCLEAADCGGNAACEALITARIKQLDAEFDDDDDADRR